MKNFFEIIFRRKQLIFIPFIIIFLIPSFLSFFLLRKYEASSIIWVDSDPLTQVALDSPTNTATPAEEYAENIGQLLQSRSFVKKVILKTNLKHRAKTKQDVDRLITSVSSDITSFSNGPRSVKVLYSSSDPIMCMQIVRAATEEFIEWNYKSLKRQSSTSAKFFEKQRKTQDQQLGEARLALREFKEQHPETELLEEKKMLLTPMQTGVSPQVQTEFDRLQQEYEYCSKLYNSALDNLAEARITGEAKLQKERDMVRIIDSAEIPTTYSRKQLLLPIGFSFFLALVVAVSAVALRELTDQTLRTEEEAAHQLDVPILATISKMGQKTEKNLGVQSGLPKRLREWLGGRFNWAEVQTHNSKEQ